MKELGRKFPNLGQVDYSNLGQTLCVYQEFDCKTPWWKKILSLGKPGDFESSTVCCWVVLEAKVVELV